MKKFYSLCALLSFFSLYTHGQIVVEINSTFGGTHTISSGAPSDAVPYNYNDKSVHLQILYPASDLNMGGAGIGFTIDSIGWYVVDQIAGNLQNYTIKMKNTTNTNTVVYDGTGLTTVRSASPLVPAVDTAWYMIPLTNHFYWDGTSNLLVDVCWSGNSSNSPTGKVRHYSYGNTGERILLKSNVSNTCSSPTTQVAFFRPYLRLTGVCVDTAVVRNGNVLVASQPAATYQWIDCNTNLPISGATSSIYLPTASGSYAVAITHGTCVDTSNCHVISLTGLQDIDNEGAFSVYPNPTTDVIGLKATTGEYRVTIFSSNGAQLLQQTMNLNADKGTALDVSSYKNQVLVVEVVNTLTGQTFRKLLSVIGK